jgi:hypothetical protein
MNFATLAPARGSMFGGRSRAGPVSEAIRAPTSGVGLTELYGK